ncbi:30S ribosomal protein S15, partial [Corynebacterium diphtheriae]
GGEIAAACGTPARHGAHPRIIDTPDGSAPIARGRRGLMALVGRRRRMLGYLQKVDIERYRALIERLGLRK